MRGGGFQDLSVVGPWVVRGSLLRRFGQNLNLRDALCFLTYGGSDTVRPRIPASDHQDMPSFSTDMFVVWYGHTIHDPVLLGKEFHRKVNAVQVSSGNRK